MKVTIIPIVIGSFGTVTKGLLKGLKDLEVEGRVDTIQTTTLLRTARILRRILENLLNCELHCPGRAQSKIESMRKEKKYLDLARELKKL